MRYILSRLRSFIRFKISYFIHSSFLSLFIFSVSSALALDNNTFIFLFVYSVSLLFSIVLSFSVICLVQVVLMFSFLNNFLVLRYDSHGGIFIFEKQNSILGITGLVSVNVCYKKSRFYFIANCGMEDLLEHSTSSRMELEPCITYDKIFFFCKNWPLFHLFRSCCQDRSPQRCRHIFL